MKITFGLAVTALSIAIAPAAPAQGARATSGSSAAPAASASLPPLPDSASPAASGARPAPVAPAASGVRTAPVAPASGGQASPASDAPVTAHVSFGGGTPRRDSADAPYRVAPNPDWGETIGRFELGYRGLFVTNAGYNPFSDDDYFDGVALAVSRTVFSRGHFSFAPGIAWDYGSSSAIARGDATSLRFERLTIPLEGRMHVGRWGYAYGRLAPGAAMEHAEADDPSAPSALTKTRWLFTGDASVGYAFPIPPLPASLEHALRIWIQSDVGYSWAASDRLVLEPNGMSNAGSVDLGSLGMRGAFMRFAVAASY